jgi:D-3-phosphoglycerate dehydrogenase / 2-oxoglutarate reductase
VSGAANATVLVTARSFGRAAPELRQRLEDAVAEVRYNERGRPLDAAELREALVGVDGVIAGTERFDEAALSAAPRLRAIARYGVGTDGVDLAAAAERGIVVTNTPGANSEAVAELAIGLMFALARRIPQQSAAARAGSWRPVQGIQLAGRTVGLLGLGRVGAAVARRAAALGCEVVGFDPAVDAGEARAMGARLATAAEVAAESEFLSLHLPVTAETTDQVDAGFLAGMRDGAFLLNTGRGELVVERDLLEALERGALAGAALDTLREEPPAPDHPLLARDDVIVTPHAGAQTAEAGAAMGGLALDDLLAVLGGRPPRHPVEARDG